MNRNKLILIAIVFIALFFSPNKSQAVVIDDPGEVVVDCNTAVYKPGPPETYIFQNPDVPGQDSTIEVTKEVYEKQCTPARLRDLQPLVVRLIYFTWAGGIFIFVFAFGYIGYNYMTSGSDSGKKQDLAKRGGWMILGIIVFFAAQPVAAFMMKLVVTNESDCYGDLNDTPGFTFFFTDVCDPESTSGSLPSGHVACPGFLDPINTTSTSFCIDQCETQTENGRPFDYKFNYNLPGAGTTEFNCTCRDPNGVSVCKSWKEIPL